MRDFQVDNDGMMERYKSKIKSDIVKEIIQQTNEGLASIKTKHKPRRYDPKLIKAKEEEAIRNAIMKVYYNFSMFWF